jgi:uncharacterized membrane protein (UPF0127 family)
MSWRSSTAALAALLLTACAGGSHDGGAATTAAGSSATVSSSGAPDATPRATASTGSAATATTVTAPPTAPPMIGSAPTGFATVAGRVTAADGATCDVCLWLADTPGLRAQGLMGVTDLSGADGMVFRWDEPTSDNFWMRDTPTPLSIAFYDGDGSFVSSADMAPCLQPTPDAECARYAAAGPYQDAVEVAAGGLADLLMGPGSHLEVFPEDCPLAP